MLVLPPKRIVGCGGRAGVALASVLLVSLVILTLGLGLLSVCQRDLRFQRVLQSQDRARVLARAALEHYMWMKVSLMLPPEVAPPAAQPDFLFQVDISANERLIIETVGTASPGLRRDVLCSGVILDELGATAAQARIMVPRGNDGGAYAL